MERLRTLVAALEAAADEAAASELTAELRSVESEFAAAELEAQSQAVALAARLIELKARALLPGAPPPEPEATEGADETPEALAQRVAAYAAFQEAAEVLRAYEERRGRRFGRPPSPAPGPADPPAVPLQALLDVFAAVWARARPAGPSIAGARVTLQVRMDELRAVLRGAGSAIAFESLFEDAGGERVDLIVTFLALLELMRLGEASLDQEDPFGPIRVVAARPA